MPRRLLLALPVALLVSCGGSEPSSTSSALPSPSVQESANAVASGVASDAAQQTLSLTVAKGEVTGDTGRVTVARGTRLRITVTADVADELHVHAYDLRQQISANGPGSIEFVADKPGVVEVELERTKLVLTRLVIS